MTEEEIKRAEYEQFIRTYELRHAELRTELKEVEVDMRDRISNLGIKLDNLSTQMSKLDNDVAAKSLDAWKIIATSALSLIVGYVVHLAQVAFFK